MMLSKRVFLHKYNGDHYTLIYRIEEAIPDRIDRNVTSETREVNYLVAPLVASRSREAIGAIYDM